ncbi:dihydrolipoamide acetyltransferase family protein [Govanella unica]|uniref:Dihydrolipoamide acetyltransferase component of pyruvate dehydrogenase complex n=1 Tax=Govanella unica TaxID=2975056 RepID=A0A9X3Z7S8_9PROT|nr:2-oxo acid dehydrogenase subunit E2 [Govania unica]MDA5194507.1 2-oxo acid dehydrogenase subunit E2 [Govania unica]
MTTLTRIDVKAPEGQDEGTRSRVARWLKQPGDQVTIHEPLVELETDKVAMEVSAPASGILGDILVAEGTDVDPGTLLARIDSGAVAAPAKAETHAAATDKPIAAQAERSQKLSPLVRRLLSLHDLDPAAIEGTGIGGRLRRDDVLGYVKGRETPTAKAAPKAIAKPPLARSAGTSFVPHDNMRQRIAAHMVESLLHTAPHVTSVFEADFSRIIAHRKRHKDTFAQQGVKLTLTAYFVAACCDAIAAVPTVNSRYHDDGLELFHDANIGVGTALEDKGLIVPVIQRAQTLNLLGIAGQLQALTDKARTGKLEPQDVRGGTFTISNHGVSGSLLATPIIINQPQSAILGIGKLEKRLTVVTQDGQDSIQIRQKAYVTLTIDHRVLDGYQTNSFLTRLVEVIESWPEDKL